MKKDSKIFIAGHRGLVGSAILKELQDQGYSNLLFKTHQELDLKDSQALYQFLKQEKVEYIFLCAAKVGGILANNTYRADFIYENLVIQNNVIFCAYQLGIKKLLFLGSSCIYPKNAPQPMQESALLSSELEYTNEPYAVAKIAGLKMCESFNLQYGTNFLSVMPTNLYGENDNFDLQTSHVLPAILRKMHLAKLYFQKNLDAIAKDLKIPQEQIPSTLEKYGITKHSLTLWGSGKAQREFLHSKDMAKACVFLMEKINFSDLIQGQQEIRNTHLNIGYGEDLSIQELALMIQEILNYQGEILFDSTKPDGTMKKLLDCSKINKLGWKAQIPLKQGIQEVYQHYLQRSGNV